MGIGDTVSVSASAWLKGIAFSVAASVIGGASKLAIRKSWLLQEQWQLSTDDGGGGDECIEGGTDDVYFGERMDVDTLIPARGHTLTEDTEAMDEQDDGSAYGSMNHNVALHATAQPYTDEPEEIVNYNSETWVPRKRTWLPRILRGAGLIGMTILNPACCVLAMNYASPSILAPFSGMTLVWILLGSNWLLGEPPSRRQVVAACLIIFGEVVVAAFGDHTNQRGVTTYDVKCSYKEPAFLVYIAMTFAFFLLLVYLMGNARSPTIRRFAWGVSGGYLAGFQNFLKDALTMLNASGAESNTTWALLAFLSAMAMLTALGGLLLLTACMKRYDATFSASMYVGGFVVSASIMSAIHYDTFSHLHQFSDEILYPTGMLILMAGLYLLVTEKKMAEEIRQEDETC